MKNIRIVLALAATLLGACSTSAPLKTVNHVDIPRYMGDWRVIANIPYFAEKDCVDTIESYALRPDGRIDNWFTYRKPTWDSPQEKFTALAKVHNTTTNAEWRIRFFGLVTVPYFITDLDPNYRWAVVAHPSRDYGWIMARERTMPEKTYQAILGRLKEQGYDPARFVKVPQVAPRK
jgi:apolipoprotein D and lipocalin family protein